jgi:hypothetical protein
VSPVKRGRVTPEAEATITEVALARLQRPKILTDAEHVALTGLSKSRIHQLMKRVKLSVAVKTGDTDPLNPPLDTQTASESAMP